VKVFTETETVKTEFGKNKSSMYTSEK